jgi:hypothetical protein
MFKLGLAQVNEKMETQVLLFFLVIVIWLVVLSFFVFRTGAFFNKLTRGVKDVDLKKVLDRILENEVKSLEDLKDVKKKIEFLEEDGRHHVQKLGLVRFNPFKELGGDHSFSLAVLNGKNSGVIITSLHTRDRTRIYVKSVKKGKSDGALSEEEKKALTLAEKE